jgi:hypothetical protein
MYLATLRTTIQSVQIQHEIFEITPVRRPAVA